MKAIAAGLITVGYIVITFPFAWQRAIQLPRTSGTDYIN
jgi:hypothetical protein